MKKECGCPDWVVQCVHFDGKWVVLHKPWAPRYEGQLVVCSGNGQVDTGNHYFHSGVDGYDAFLGDEEAAREQFAYREWKLLRKEASHA